MITTLLVINYSCDEDSIDTIYTVTIFSNGGTNFAPIRVVAGETIPMNKLYPSPITNDGGSFIGWYIDENLETEFDPTMPVLQDMVLYAKWFYETYKVSFVMNGAVAIPDLEVRKGKQAELGKPLFDDHIFVGWYEDAELTKLFDAKTVIGSDLTLYARWVTPSPEHWFYIESGVLYACNPPEGTKVVVIPEGVKVISDWFVLANGLNEPGKPGFPTGKNIEEFIFPESLERIGMGAFKFSAITSIIIPPNVKELVQVSFQGCDRLKNFYFANNSKLEKVESNASNEPVISSTSLESISFPPSMQYIGKYVLSGCTALKTVTFERYDSPVLFYDFLPGGGVWLFGGYFPTKIRVPNIVKDSFINEMRKTMQDYEFDNMSKIVEGY